MIVIVAIFTDLMINQLKISDEWHLLKLSTLFINDLLIFI